MPGRHQRRSRAALPVAALTLAAVAATAGCSTLTDVTSPADAREAAAAESGTVLVADTVNCVTDQCVALTFDGGPSEPTPDLLDLLLEEDVPVTFFLEGDGHVDTYPETVVRMVEEGHEIANHTWNHPVLTDLTEAEIRAEIEPLQELIEEITGITPDLMRPPQGRTSDEVSEIMRDLGLAQILWSVTAKDYETTDTELIVERVLDGAERDGVILLHERYAGTIPAVPEIITELRARGYTFVTVSQLMAPAVPEPGAVYRP
ncbi:polysaccharide deacetylase family protein [Streptomyces otsuchiensis]|uniref:polysaccharide deacetylase family protein n=1 Tax=Streptomyces otsuchiensis TaxID=2681388 RepID=UPI003F68ACC2